MFIHNMSESQHKIIDIEDLDFETVKDMLRWSQNYFPWIMEENIL